MKPHSPLLRILTAAGTLTGFLSASLALGQPQLNDQHPGVRAVMALQAEVTPGWMNSPGILGTAVGVDDTVQPALVVYVDRDHTRVADVVRSIPVRMRGIGVRIELTEKFRALKPPSGDAAAKETGHTAKQTLPIQLGTSGGWRNDLANGYCCGGTLGSLIQVNGVRYILSNYHVLEADIVLGGNGMVAATGDYVIQPGLIDVGCSASSAQNVATLKVLNALPGNNVDCAIAQVIPEAVDANGAILDIGKISTAIRAPALNVTVKKSGRTTGLTRSKISGLNATIRVSYENECAGSVVFTKTFTGQIVIANKGSSFIKGGDSGSLMVEDVATSPKPIGLLFAGSNTSAIANPIGEVLSFIGGKLGGTASMVGN